MNTVTVGNFVASSKPRQEIKKNKKEWLEFEEPVITSIIGMRGGGKSALGDELLQKYYDRHFTCLHLFSGRSLENLYPVINKGCNEHFRKIKLYMKNEFYYPQYRPTGYLFTLQERDYYMKLAERGGFVEKKLNGKWKITNAGDELLKNQRLHCRCSKAIPILLLVPDYVKFDQESVDRFNGCFWKDFDECKKYIKELTREEKELLKQEKLRKPDCLIPKPLFKYRHFTVPNTEVRKNKFVEEWTESVLMAREEHRILVMSPLFFRGDHKFQTIAGIASYHPTLMLTSGHFDSLTEAQVGKPYNRWNNKEKNWDKIAVFIDEARSVIPSSKMHGEKGAGASKKEIFDKVPEMRQFKTWLFLLYQNPTDVYDGVRVQDNMTVIKRTHLGLAGEYWKWIFKKVLIGRWGLIRRVFQIDDEEFDESRMNKLEWKLKYQAPNALRQINSIRPKIDDMDSDKAYVVRNGDIKLIKNGMASWHHRQELETFSGDTGIKWCFDTNRLPEESEKKPLKADAKQRKELKKQAFEILKQQWEVEKNDWNSILHHMIELQEQGHYYEIDFKSMLDKKGEKKASKAMSDRYRQLKNQFETLEA